MMSHTLARPPIDTSPEAIDQRRKAHVSAQASNEIEELYDDGGCADITEAWISGRIDSAERMRRIVARHTASR